jgi:hypothetical protein
MLFWLTSLTESLERAVKSKHLQKRMREMRDNDA